MPPLMSTAEVPDDCLTFLSYKTVYKVSGERSHGHWSSRIYLVNWTKIPVTAPASRAR